MKILETIDILGKRVSDLPGLDGPIPFNYKVIVADPNTGAMAQVTKTQLQAFAGGGGQTTSTPGEASFMSPTF
jgi:hypothetical protein